MEGSSINILLTGVGGQGIITLAKVIGEVFNRRNIRVLMAETHGMSQRGGSVVVHVRIGEVNYPLIPIGGADVILGLELVETFRYLNYASSKTIVITNDNMIRPGLPNVKMPDKQRLVEAARKYGLNIYYVDGLSLAMEAGSAISLNMVMLGALVASNVFKDVVNMDDFIQELSKLPMSQINVEAFKLGYSKFREMFKGK